MSIGLPGPTGARLNPADVLRRICVRPPYFALNNLWVDGPELRTLVLAELPQSPETGPLQAAELSRHAAIAGLCAAAMQQKDDDRRYYLARQAKYEGFRNDARYGTPVELRARCVHLGKREARAHIWASSGDQPVAKLEVMYTVLTESAFERLFRAKRQAASAGPRMSTLPPGRTTRRGDTLVKVIDRIPAEACAGHFEHHPAMPVAVLMGQLAQLAADALGGGRLPHRIVSGDVEATDLCWAGENATFEVTPEGHEGSKSAFACKAFAEERLVASMRLIIQGTASG